MLTRRDTLRLAALSTLAISGALSGCGSDPDSGPVTDSRIDLASSDLTRAAGRADAVPEVAASLQGFAGHLYGKAPAEDNLIISPFSVAVALGMTVNGAVGATKQEMLDVLGVQDLGRFNGGLNALTQELESLAGPVQRADGSKAAIALDSANSLWGQRGMAWVGAFLDELARDYGTGMRQVDYVGAVEAARQLINGWTAEQTHDKIKDLIPQGVLDALTRLVLVNAIYLKAPWEQPFEPTLTKDGPFDGGRVTVQMMTGSEVPASYRAGDGWQAATLAYAGGSVAMTIVLPDLGRLAEIEAAVAAGGVQEYLAGGESTALRVTMPKWTTRSSLSLREALAALGMPTAFDPNAADFSAMTTAAELYISAVVHQGYIAVDEEGTEAAAATAVVMRETSARLVDSFIVDRPFVYVVHDTAHGTPLFLGRVVDPTAS